MLGYTDPYRIEDKTKALCYVKNSYVVESDVYSEDILRHDCHFQILPDSEKKYLFHPNPNQRKSTEDPEEDERIEKELQNEYDSSSGGNPKMGKSSKKVSILFPFIFQFFHSPES